MSNGATFGYDGNGNMTRRVKVVGGQSSTYLQGWDVENRLIAITNTTSGQVTTYSYNASGQRVKRVDASGTLVTLGAHFEQLRVGAAVTNTSYYFFGDQRVVMRQTNAGTGASTVYWLHGDHLGSASLTTSITGTKVAELRYYAYGEMRWAWPNESATPTDRTFTGQRSEKASYAGSLMDYGARFYSPLLGRFLSADSLVPQPGDPQSLNRYAYVLGNPLKYTDPTGHDVDGCNNGVCPSGMMGGYQYGVAGSILGAEQLQVASLNASALQVQAGIGFGGVGPSSSVVSQFGDSAGKSLGAALAGIKDAAASALWYLAAKCLLNSTCERILYWINGIAPPKAGSGWGNLSQAEQYGIKSYKELRADLAGTGLEAHHLIEKRFASRLGVLEDDMMSVAVTKAEHEIFSKAWIDAIAHTNMKNPLNTRTATVDDIWEAAQRIYADYPELLEAARRQLGK